MRWAGVEGIRKAKRLRNEVVQSRSKKTRNRLKETGGDSLREEDWGEDKDD